MGGDDAGRGSGLLMALLFLSFLCFVSAEILVKPTTKTVTGRTSDIRGIIETERYSLQGTNVNYVSKRRVPSEPDPIHNR